MMDEYEVFYQAWLKNHPSDARAIIGALEHSHRYLYMTPKQGSVIEDVVKKYGEATMKILYPFLDKTAKQNVEAKLSLIFGEGCQFKPWPNSNR